MTINILDLPLALKNNLEFIKKDINTGKVRCSVLNHLLNVCRSSAIKFEYLQVQLIEKVSVQNDHNIDHKFCGKEQNTGTRNYLH